MDGISSLGILDALAGYRLQRHPDNPQFSRFFEQYGNVGTEIEAGMG